MNARTQTPKDSLRVALLCGGESHEREISLQSGAAVAGALAVAGHQVVSIDPAGRALSSIDWQSFDACVVALHGGAGEDGRMQLELEALGVPYTGSGPRASRLAMSKWASARRFQRHAVRTPPTLLVKPEDDPRQVAERAQAFDYPLVIKPDQGGSSLGVTVVNDAGDVAAGLAEARRYDSRVVIQPYVQGREFTVAFIDDRPLPVVEIVSPEPTFSYRAKYESARTEFRLDFELPNSQHGNLLWAARKAIRALGTAGLARVDVMLARDGRPWVLEVNTVPGMTERSLAPLAASRAGIDLSSLCDLLVRQCLRPASVA